MLKLFLLPLLLRSCSDKQDTPEDPVAPIDKELLLTLVNAQRSQGCQCGDTYYPAVPPLTWNDQLASVAQKHSNEMAKYNKLSHNSQNGDDPGQRLSKAGYHWNAFAENVAVGYPDESAVIQGWIQSPAHCANIMNPNVKEMGVGKKDKYWTQVFGSRPK